MLDRLLNEEYLGAQYIDFNDPNKIKRLLTAIGTNTNSLFRKAFLGKETVYIV